MQQLKQGSHAVERPLHLHGTTCRNGRSTGKHFRVANRKWLLPIPTGQLQGSRARPSYFTRHARIYLSIIYHKLGVSSKLALVQALAANSPEAVVEAAAPRRPGRPSIAVMAFDNISGDPGQDYFSDGISDDIITALSRSPWLFVIARNPRRFMSHALRTAGLMEIGDAAAAREAVDVWLEAIPDTKIDRLRIYPMQDQTLAKKLRACLLEAGLPNAGA